MAERVFGDRYRIVRHLAKGGMAEVYVAEDQLLNRSVALKVLFPQLAQDDAFVERFRREARAAASLNHHNIVSVYDFGEDDGSWFIVMEYVDGPTLRDIIRREGPMDPSRTAEIGAEVAAALAAAHAQGIVHRDVKPANVLIAEPAGTVKVTDFGIARAANARQGLTMPGTVLGTATYLSPEQAQGAAVDHRTDLYSLGMVLYEMLAGRPPFVGESPVAVAYQQLNQQAPAPSTHNNRVPPALDAVVMKAMSKNPADRQFSAEDMRKELLALDRAVGSPDATAAIVPPTVGATAVYEPSTSVMPPPPPAPPPVTARPSPAMAGPDDADRRRRAAVIAVLALLALGVVLALALRGGDEDQGTVAVPNVVGRSVAEATSALEDAGLDVHVTERAGGTPGQVSDQDPDAGAVVAKDTTVTLFVPPAATSTTARTATTTATTAPATTATTTATTAPPTTQAPTTTVAPPTTAAPTSSIVLPTVVLPTTRP